MITPAIANAEDIIRLMSLEGTAWPYVPTGKWFVQLPIGTAASSVKAAIVYLERIAYLSATSHGQRQPKVYLNEYVNPQTP
jgi:hypothetical protein